MTTLGISGDEYLEDHIDAYYEAEAISALSGKGYCLKPLSSLDLMLHARKGPYQSTMDRADIRIKKVPSVLAQELADELTNRIHFNDVYFARKSNSKERWKVHDIKDDLGETIREFKDICLIFAPSSALKALVIDIGLRKIDSRLQFFDVEINKAFMPQELGYAPYGKAANDEYGKSWKDVIEHHIDHWEYNSLARQYAEDDVIDTRSLYYYFSALEAGMPTDAALDAVRNDMYNIPPMPLGDDDSILACMVGAIRWRGFKLDLDKLSELKNKAVRSVASNDINFNSPEVCKKYLLQVLDDTEQHALSINGKITTKAIVLEDLAKWKVDEVCLDCKGFGCDKCNEGLTHSDKPHPVAERAQRILDIRHAQKEIELYNKLLRSKRFYASFKIIGALSSRMSGSDGLNPQGIKRTTEVRSCFPLADDGMVLIGGDFAGSQVAIADAVFADPILHDKLISGKKIHALFGEHLFPGLSYDDILATKGLPGDQDKYGRSKNGVFAMLFGGESYTLQTRVGITESAADAAYQSWIDSYKVWGQKRKQYFDMFCSMRQPNGIGTKVEWHEPADYVEAMFGFRRYFTLENKICKTLFDLAENPPEKWTKIKLKVVRRDRVQSSCGALRSALFAAAFSIQASNMRAAANHVIQSPEALMVKNLQRRIWDLQPSGISEWKVSPLNVHDELMVPCLPDIVNDVDDVVKNFIIDMREHIPLIEIDWSNNLKTWADK